MISQTHDEPLKTTKECAETPGYAAAEGAEVPRNLRVALLEDILSLREHRIAQLEHRINTLENSLEAKDEELRARACERRQLIENYERILDERAADGDHREPSEHSAPIDSIIELFA